MKNSNKGFTLVELLAVIVVLALLLAIAIPAVTKYITQSRIKTLIKTTDSYVTAVINDVNDGKYKFTSRGNTVFAVPIECISLEKGGTNPFGEWMNANEDYWAYVLVQYDSVNSKYIYGFTFKDSAGYGMYPTQISVLKETGKQIKNGLSLQMPESGSYLNIADTTNWDGFVLNEETSLVVLKGVDEGDGETTCTLTQKGDNYDETIEETNNLYDIVKDSVLVGKGKQYTGLGYKDYAKKVYFYNDSMTNNVLFANYCWKIIRTTDTGGVKLIYNGEPYDGTCNNSGSSTQIASSKFSDYSSSLADVGYMNGTAYEYDYKKIGTSGSTSINVSTFDYDIRKYYYQSFSNYVYGTGVTYSNGVYTLTNPTTLTINAENSERLNKYTCLSTSTTCSTVYYVTYVYKLNNSNYYYKYLDHSGISLSSGQLLTDLVAKVGDSYTINADGTFTLNNVKELNRLEIKTSSKKYFCPDTTSTTCERIYYLSGTKIASTSSYNSIYTQNLKLNYIDYTVNLVFGEKFTFDGSNYKLKETTKIKHWHSIDSLKSHYTCLSDDDECSTLYYIYKINDNDVYYIELEDGVSLENAKSAMLTDNASNSKIKSIVDEWYEDNLASYTSMIEDTVYCNNRNVSTQGGWDSNNNDLKTDLKFYSYDYKNLSCSNKEDRFTVSSSIGNGKLAYPVGLITAPEVNLWGGSASGSSYWTMSPFGYGAAAAHVYKVWDDGWPNFDRVTYSNGVRPVISLKPLTKVNSGDGTAENPYTIE